MNFLIPSRRCLGEEKVPRLTRCRERTENHLQIGCKKRNHPVEQGLFRIQKNNPKSSRRNA
ncbi:MAG: hypothetical protein DRI57_11950 [Deltaproteobacteria bacterium]|nr:MAG: hypothetical protein DRI57_11950 [Deltaproteobacteria bacterium]